MGIGIPIACVAGLEGNLLGLSPSSNIRLGERKRAEGGSGVLVAQTEDDLGVVSRKGRVWEKFVGGGERLGCFSLQGHVVPAH